MTSTIESRTYRDLARARGAGARAARVRKVDAGFLRDEGRDEYA